MLAIRKIKLGYLAKDNTIVLHFFFFYLASSSHRSLAKKKKKQKKKSSNPRQTAKFEKHRRKEGKGRGTEDDHICRALRKKKKKWLIICFSSELKHNEFFLGFVLHLDVKDYLRNLEMSLLLRLRHRFSNGLCRHSSHAIALNFVDLNGSFRYLSLPARKEDEQEEEVEIDQRRLPADYDPATFDPTEHRSPPTDRVFRLVDEISGLTLVEVAELSSILMKKLGMKEPPVVGVMKPGAAGLTGMAMKAQTAAKEEKKPEKTVFELKLESYETASKIKIIKEVRSFTDLGLKEAKDLVEKAPAVVKKGVSKEEGEQIIEKMKALGAKVVME